MREFWSAISIQTNYVSNLNHDFFERDYNCFSCSVGCWASSKTNNLNCFVSIWFMQFECMPIELETRQLEWYHQIILQTWRYSYAVYYQYTVLYSLLITVTNLITRTFGDFDAIELFWGILRNVSIFPSDIKKPPSRRLLIGYI